jgi:hypothetical protein
VGVGKVLEAMASMAGRNIESGPAGFKKREQDGARYWIDTAVWRSNTDNGVRDRIPSEWNQKESDPVWETREPLRIQNRFARTDDKMTGSCTLNFE